MQQVRLMLICGLPGAREERDELRLAGRKLGATVELHYLEASVDELWRRLERRNREGAPGTVPITRDDLENWALQFEPPDAGELALFDHPDQRNVCP